MKDKDVFLILRGRLYWAKIVGKARPYQGNPEFDKGPEWTVDLIPDANSLKLLKEHGLLKKLREPSEKDSRTEKFLSFRVLENRPDGSKNDPPKISNIAGQPWDSSLIGNETVADVKVKVKFYGATTGMYLHAVRVLKHVPFVVEDFPSIDEDDEFFPEADEDEAPVLASSASPSPEDLDEDIPF